MAEAEAPGPSRRSAAHEAGTGSPGAPAGEPPPATRRSTTTRPKDSKSPADQARTIGGLIAVCVGSLAVVTIGVVAIAVDTANAGTIAGATVAVIGSIVGAYLGVKVGTDQTRTALDQLERSRDAHDQTSKRAEAYALHVDKRDARDLRVPGER